MPPVINGIKSGVDKVKEIASEGTKWPSDYLNTQNSNESETQ